MFSHEWQFIFRRTILRAMALLLLLVIGAMEYSHLEYHRELVPEPGQHRHGVDRDHALFHCGPIAEPPPDLIGPIISFRGVIPPQIIDRPVFEIPYSIDARAPPRKA